MYMYSTFKCPKANCMYFLHDNKLSYLILYSYNIKKRKEKRKQTLNRHIRRR